MVSKKLKLLLALVGLVQTASFAQSSTDANWAYDSTKAADKAQYNEFANYQNPYPSSAMPGYKRWRYFLMKLDDDQDGRRETRRSHQHRDS